MTNLATIAFAIAAFGFATPASACYTGVCPEIKEVRMAKPPCKPGLNEVKRYSYDPRVVQTISDMQYVDTVCSLGKTGYGWANGPLVETSLEALHASLDALRNEKW